MPATLVIFGASGDLTSRKLMPAMYELFRKKRLPPGTNIVGFARSEFSDAAWRASLAKTTQEHSGKDFDPALWQQFSRTVYYHQGDIGRAEDFQRLAARLEDLEGKQPSTRIYYLATGPQFYEEAATRLGAGGLADEGRGARRIVIEKPFGTDAASARRLNEAVHRVFSEKQVFRIDHYLGKETVQNLLVLRFANTIFEPIWNRNYVDHVQITVAEEVTVGHRARYYETAGVLRDMFQNHLLQLLMITAMEAPVRYEADSVRNEKVKVLEAVRPLSPERIAADTLRGQYRGYRQEPDVAANSQIATFGIVKLAVDNWRWQGVPFYLRTGKAMSCRTTQIVIQFRCPPHMLFAAESPRGCEGDKLVVQVQPAEGIQIHFQSKVPDAGMKLRTSNLDFSFQRESDAAMPEAYERLLLDVFQGDASLFTRADEAELAWGIIDPIAAEWEKKGQPPLAIYEPGVWGPESGGRWMEEQGRQWFDTCPVLR